MVHTHGPQRKQITRWSVDMLPTCPLCGETQPAMPPQKDATRREAVA